MDIILSCHPGYKEKVHMRASHAGLLARRPALKTFSRIYDVARVNCYDYLHVHFQGKTLLEMRNTIQYTIHPITTEIVRIIQRFITRRRRHHELPEIYTCYNCKNLIFELIITAKSNLLYLAVEY